MSADITEIRTVAIPVSDQERALEFFTSILGFETRMDAAFGGGMRWIEVAPKGSAATIALPPPGPGAAPGVDTGIRVTCTDADAVHRRLRDAGVDVDTDVMRWPGVPAMFSLRDPDGNVLYVVEQE
jgi:predicted enzyme related to lactoylglutathione lyase